MKKLHVPFIQGLSDLPQTKLKQVISKQTVPSAIECVNWIESFPYSPNATFHIARDETNLYIHFFVQGNSLRAKNTDDLSAVWTDSCVEFFMKKVDENIYQNFEFNCIGTCYAARRESRDNFTLLAESELQTIRRFPSIERVPFEEIEGEYSWDLLVEIPFALMGLDGRDLPEKIEANFYKCADATAFRHYVSWNEIKTLKPDFHQTEFFGELYF